MLLELDQQFRITVFLVGFLRIPFEIVPQSQCHILDKTIYIVNLILAIVW